MHVLVSSALPTTRHNITDIKLLGVTQNNINCIKRKNDPVLQNFLHDVTFFLIVCNMP